MTRDWIIVILLVGFFGLLVWGANHKKDPVTGKIVPIEHNIVTHELVCVTVKEDYCFRYEIRRIIKE